MACSFWPIVARSSIFGSQLHWAKNNLHCRAGSLYSNILCSDTLPESYHGGGVGDDVLHVPPAETGTDLQHEGHHSCRQGGRSRRASVALRTAGPLQHGPVGRHLWKDGWAEYDHGTLCREQTHYKGGNSSGRSLHKLPLSCVSIH